MAKTLFVVYRDLYWNTKKSNYSPKRPTTVQKQDPDTLQCPSHLLQTCKVH